MFCWRVFDGIRWVSNALGRVFLCAPWPVPVDSCWFSGFRVSAWFMMSFKPFDCVWYICMCYCGCGYLIFLVFLCSSWKGWFTRRAINPSQLQVSSLVLIRTWIYLSKRTQTTRLFSSQEEDEEGVAKQEDVFFKKEKVVTSPSRRYIRKLV